MKMLYRVSSKIYRDINRGMGRRKNLTRKRRTRSRKSIKRVRRSVYHGGISTNPQEDVGFIILRCVKTQQQNILFKESYEAVRKYYPDIKIIIIDDNSDKSILDNAYPMKNVEVIESELPVGTGEYLPYWYLLQRKMFKKAIFLQDSMILNAKIPFEDVNDYMYLYEFQSNNPNYFNFIPNEEIINLLKLTKDSENIMKYYNAGEWKGCWGSMMLITSDFITELEEKVGISVWKGVITSRPQRMALEAAIGIACMYIKHDKEKYSFFGDWADSNTFKDPGNENHTLDMYLENKTRIKNSIIKIWNNR